VANQPGSGKPEIRRGAQPEEEKPIQAKLEDQSIRRDPPTQGASPFTLPDQIPAAAVVLKSRPISILIRDQLPPANTAMVYRISLAGTPQEKARAEAVLNRLSGHVLTNWVAIPLERGLWLVTYVELEATPSPNPMDPPLRYVYADRRWVVAYGHRRIANGMYPLSQERRLLQQP
jgi:hypothetical protein